jgi:hypothetical protein
MRRRGKSGVAGLAWVECCALVLALGGCSSDSGSGSGSASTAASNDSGYSDVVHVTGTSTRIEGINWLEDASDPRVSGDSTADGQCGEMIEDGNRTITFCTVTSTITNDGGTWEGGCTGTATWTVTEPEVMHDFDCTLVGVGGYLGLRYRYNTQGGDEDSGPFQTTGQIESFTPSAS